MHEKNILNMKKIIFTTILISTISFCLQAQNLGSTYKTAVGVKFYPGGISFKTFTDHDKAIEGIGYFYGDGFRLTGLYEIHGEIDGVDGLKWYVGPGAHIGTWNDSWKKENPTRDGGTIFGIDGVLGLDYKINKAPIAVSLDWQPSFNFVGYSYFESGWGGLGVRYTF